MSEILKTGELVTRIEERWGYRYDRVTILAWAKREVDPLPAVYQGRRGQSSRFDWAVAEPWLEAEFEVQSKVDMGDIDRMDLMGARTLRARELGKQAMLDTAERAGELVSRREVELEAENLAAIAAQMLLAIPDRISAVLAHETDETRVAEILDRELRSACNHIADVRPAGADECEPTSNQSPPD